MSAPEGFRFTERKNGEVVIEHGKRTASILRGRAAERFLVDVSTGDPQQVMARVTGSYRHGNERTASDHPRNQPGRR